MVFAVLFKISIILLKTMSVVIYTIAMCFWRKKKVQPETQEIRNTGADKAATINETGKTKDETVTKPKSEHEFPTNTKESPNNKKFEKSAVTQVSTDKVDPPKSPAEMAPTMFTFEALPDDSGPGDIKTELSAGEECNPFASTKLQSRIMGPTSKMNALNSKMEPSGGASTNNTNLALKPLCGTQETLSAIAPVTENPVGKGNHNVEQTQASPSVLTPVTPDCSNMGKPTTVAKTASETNGKPKEAKKKSSVSLYVIPS